MTRKLNLSKVEASALISDLLDYMEDGESIEVELKDDKFIVIAPDEVINSYEDDVSV